MTFDPANPQPGLYEHVPAQTYHKLDHCCNSRLSLIQRSPAHLRHEIDNPRPVPKCVGLSDYFAFGQLVHCLVLEPETVADFFVEMPSFKTPRGGTAFKERDAWLAELSADVLPVQAETWQTAQTMAAAVRRHTKARTLLNSAKQRELTGLFADPWHGEPCKFRADAVCPRFGCLIDLKTTDDASEESFAKSIARYGYHRQGAFYLRGLADCGVPLEHFAVISVEKTPPHGVSVFQVDHDALQLGEEELIPLIDRYRQCRESGRWPSYQNDGAADIPFIDLPRFYYAATERSVG